MADVKISALPAASTPLAGTEVLPIVQGGTTDKVSIADLTAGRAVNTGALTTDGNITITGTARRITGDFSNATVSSRLAFQTSTANSNSSVVVLPNGTGNSANLQLVNNSNPDNASFAQLGVTNSGTEVRVGSGATGSGAFLPMTFFTGGSERMRITSGGNLLIGTSSDNGAVLRVNGVAYFDNLVYFPAAYNQTTGSAVNAHIAADGNLFRSTSSRKYKRDIQDAAFGLVDVLALRPVTYKGTSEADGETVFGGLIAEEVHQAGLTHFVQYAADGTPDALAYGNMVALCIKAIQELKAENDALKARVTALETR